MESPVSYDKTGGSELDPICSSSPLEVHVKAECEPNVVLKDNWILPIIQKMMEVKSTTVNIL